MNELQIFENPEFGKIRTMTENGKTLFCAKDVASALGYKDTTNAIKQHCKGVVKRHLLTEGGNQLTNFISEGDIYRLAARSELPGADDFERWIFDEVIPSIRKHGAYMTPETLDRMITSPEFGIKLLTALKDEQDKRRELEAENEAMRPKALFADSVSASKNSILVGEMAKLLKQNGIQTGQNRLFETLREKGYLIKRQGNDYNMPTQKSMEMGLFEIKETVINHSDGHTSISKTPKITGKGQNFFVNMFLGSNA